MPGSPVAAGPRLWFDKQYSPLQFALTIVRSIEHTALSTVVSVLAVLYLL